MERQPWDDIRWRDILAHRPADQREAIGQRFAEAGVRPDQVETALADLGEALWRAAQVRGPAWATPFGGELAIALLAAEVSALAARRNSRSSAVRGRAVSALLDEYSAVTVAARIGVSRQKVYEIAHADAVSDRIEQPGGDRHD